jgi:hypothetical protein
MTDTLTLERLKQALSYDPETGCALSRRVCEDQVTAKLNGEGR